VRHLLTAARWITAAAGVNTCITAALAPLARFVRLAAALLFARARLAAALSVLANLAPLARVGPVPAILESDVNVVFQIAQPIGDSFLDLDEELANLSKRILQ
jgi:hypothetical protein